MRRNSAAFLACAFLAVLMLGLPGCSWFRGSDSAATQPALIAAPVSPVADVPIPSGFWMDSTASSAHVIPGSGVRFVEHYYKGTDGYLAVVRFYRDQMPAFGWTMGPQSQNTDTSFTMSFVKGNEDALITVSEGTFRSYVHVHIAPTARGTGH